MANGKKIIKIAEVENGWIVLFTYPTSGREVKFVCQTKDEVKIQVDILLDLTTPCHKDEPDEEVKPCDTHRG